MRKIWTVLGLVSLLTVATQPAWAKCGGLIREGQELLAKANLPADDAGKAKELLDEALKFNKAGDHTNGVIKANDALKILKK
jgi:hypothetical protein